MKQQILKSVMMVLVALFSLNANAYDALIDGIYYYFNNSNKTATVTYMDDTSSNSSAYSGDVNIPETVIYNEQTYTVTSIGLSAFSSCSGMTSVIIPHSVTRIAAIAFKGCSGLTSLTIPNSVKYIEEYVFNGCSGLTSITIPNSVTEIGKYAFEGCSDLTSITFPNSVTSIGEGVLRDCSSLTSIKVDNDNSIYDSRDNCNAIIVTSTNQLIAGCQNTIIPKDVKSIGSSAFSGCSGLTSITIPSSVEDINRNAFSGVRLKNVYVKGLTPSNIYPSPFSQAVFNHAILYVPVGAWDTYAFDEIGGWYNFINIREMTATTESLSAQNVYTLMNTSNFEYMVYDPVNDEIRTGVPVNSIDENNPNHCWQTVETNGQSYLYNLGAKKFAVASENGESLTLSNNVSSITMDNSEEGLVLAGKRNTQWGFVENENLMVNKDLDDIVTAIEAISYKEDNESSGISASHYNINGQQIDAPQKGVNIIRYSDGTTRKVVVK